MRKPKVSGYGGKYDKLISDGSGGGTVDWQPGDGTRYVLVSKVLQLEESSLIGAMDGSCVVSVGAGGEQLVTIVVNPGQLHDMLYVDEKINRDGRMREYNVIAFTALLNLVMGDEEYGETLFNKFIKRG